MTERCAGGEETVRPVDLRAGQVQVELADNLVGEERLAGAQHAGDGATCAAFVGREVAVAHNILCVWACDRCIIFYAC